jgi:hypothetical protein
MRFLSYGQPLLPLLALVAIHTSAALQLSLTPASDPLVARGVVAEPTIDEIKEVVLDIAKKVTALILPNMQREFGPIYKDRKVVVEGGAALLFHYPEYRKTKMKLHSQTQIKLGITTYIC